MLQLFLGEIPDLYSDDEVENIISNVRNEVKSQGLVDNRENCWKFFIERVRRQLKVRGWLLGVHRKRGDSQEPLRTCWTQPSLLATLGARGGVGARFPSDPEHLREDALLTCCFKGSSLPPAVPAFLFSKEF